MKAPEYRMYIDETGNPDLGSADNPNHRFLGLTGVICRLDHVSTEIYSEMEELKRKYFGSHPDNPIILHRKELVNKKYPFGALKNPEIESSFNHDLLDRLIKWDYVVITVVIDKREHQRTYTTWRYDPYHYCLAILLERYVFFLDEKNSVGDIMAESRGKKEDIRLKKSFQRVFLEGTNYVENERFSSRLTSRELKVKPKSNNISGLQIADLLAHPSRRQILIENNKIVDLRKNIFSDRIIEILQQKYYQKDGEIHGKKLVS